jgi:uncharacterized membrane protein (DUF2068 family)
VSEQTARSDRSLRAVTLYKTIKATLALAAGVSLGLLLLLGYGPSLHELAFVLRDHAVSGWSSKLANALFAGTTPHVLRLTTLALVFDGLLTGVEAWALRRGHTWGPWLVVGATALLVPVEIVELVRHVTAGRALVLSGNLLVVAVLLRHARKGHVSPQTVERT